MSRRQQVAVLVGLLISAVFLWFAFRDLQPSLVLDELGQVNVFWLLAGAATFFGAITVITLRWKYLLNAVKRIPLRGLFPLVCVGYMGNNVYPFRTGEALRALLLKRNHDVPIMRGATTVIVERVFDGLVMLTFIVMSLLFVESISQDVQQVATYAAPIFLIAVGTFFLLAARPNVLRRIASWFAHLLPGKVGEVVEGLSEDVIGGLEGLRTPGQLAGAVISSYATWMIEATVYWMVAWAFGMDVGYPLMLLTVAAVNLAGLIPASPGQLGVFEFFASAVLVSAGIAEATALSYAVTVHLVIWLPVTVVGFAFLAQQGLSWRAITRAREMEEQALENAESNSHMSNKAEPVTD